MNRKGREKGRWGRVLRLRKGKRSRQGVCTMEALKLIKQSTRDRKGAQPKGLSRKDARGFKGSCKNPPCWIIKE